VRGGEKEKEKVTWGERAREGERERERVEESEIG
jgi:hypothetical protein